LVGYAGILYGFLLDFALFGETISYKECLGAGLILFVTMWVSVYKLRQER
jgi:drug/metabolite transporter (DMT)-like permease